MMDGGLHAGADKLTSESNCQEEARGALAWQCTPSLTLGHTDTAPWHSTEPSSPRPAVMRIAGDSKDCLYNGRAQRTQLAPLSKATTSWLPSSVLASPLLTEASAGQPETGRTRTQFRAGGGISTEFLREKGDLECEAFLNTYHGLVLRPEDFKWAKPRVRGQETGQQITNNNIIRIIIKELGGNEE